MTKETQLKSKRKVVRKSKKTNIKLAKKSAWSVFSKYIRTILCYQSTGDITRGKCFTCSREYSIKDLQAGHFIDGRSNTVLFAEELIRLQCYGCNVGKKGNKVEYTLRMQKELGVKEVQELLDRYESKEPVQFKINDYLSITLKPY